jgi:hypothetical protein
MKNVGVIGAVTGALLMMQAVPLSAETVTVKYQGPVNLRSFDCTSVNKSSFVKRVCYEQSKRYMVIDLSGTYYHYCNIDRPTVSGLLAASSMGQFFNARIRSQGAQRGPFDCRDHPVPTF